MFSSQLSCLQVSTKKSYHSLGGDGPAASITIGALPFTEEDKGSVSSYPFAVDLMTQSFLHHHASPC